MITRDLLERLQDYENELKNFDWDNACTGDCVWYESMYDEVQDKLGLLPEGAESFSDLVWVGDKYFIKSEMVTYEDIKTYLLSRGWIRLEVLKFQHPKYRNIFIDSMEIHVTLFKKYDKVLIEIPYLPTNFALFKLEETLSRIEGLMNDFDKSLDNIKL